MAKGVKRSAKKLAKKAQKATKKGAKRVAKAAKKLPANANPAPLHTVTPYLAVGDAAGAIDWYKRVFGAKEVQRMPGPGGKLLHAHLRIGDAEVFLSDVFPGSENKDPKTVGGSTVNLHLWSRNADKWWSAAVANGATVNMPMDDMFWGDRYGKLTDPFGHSWAIAWKSKLSKAELEKKREQAMKEMAGGMAPEGAAPPMA